MKIRLLLLFLGTIQLFYAQTIKGVVIDSVTEATVPYANILLKNGKGTYANEFGEFELDIKNLATDTLKISMIGYASKMIPLQNYKTQSYIKVKLQSQVETLEEVLLVSKQIKYTDKEVLGEKREGNIGVTSLIGYETAIFIDNPRNVKGKVKRVYIDLKRRKNADYIATFNIKFYEFDSRNNKPGKMLYSENIYVTPRNRKYRLWIDVKNFNIAFPKNGICVGVELVNTVGKVKKYAYFGPMFRYTINTDRQSITWSNYHNAGWQGGAIEHEKYRRAKTGTSNPMIGIEVLYPEE